MRRDKHLAQMRAQFRARPNEFGRTCLLAPNSDVFASLRCTATFVACVILHRRPHVVLGAVPLQKRLQSLPGQTSNEQETNEADGGRMEARASSLSRPDASSGPLAIFCCYLAISCHLAVMATREPCFRAHCEAHSLTVESPCPRSVSSLPGPGAPLGRPPRPRRCAR